MINNIWSFKNQSTMGKEELWAVKMDLILYIDQVCQIVIQILTQFLLLQ